MRDWCSTCEAMRFRSECDHRPAAKIPAAIAAGMDCRATLVGVSAQPCRHGYTWQCPTAVEARKQGPVPRAGIRC